MGKLTRREALLGAAAVAALAALPVATAALPASASVRQPYWGYIKTNDYFWWFESESSDALAIMQQHFKHNPQLQAGIIKMGDKYIAANRDYGNPNAITWRFNVPLEQLPLAVRKNA